MLHVVIELFLWLFGLCVGSFLNVVIYRLDVGLSVARPLWSFCPRCEKPLAWHDNLPVLSWLRLRARCRQCAAPISAQYPLIEAATGLLFVLTYHLLFVSGSRAGVAAEVPVDLPLLLAWLALVSGMVVCAAMDIASYSLDIRVTNIVVGLGVLLHALWPRPGVLVPAAETPIAAALFAAFLVGGLAYVFQKMPVPEIDAEDAPFDQPPGADQRPLFSVGAAVAIVLVIATLTLLVVPHVPQLANSGGHFPVLLALVLLFGLVVGIGGQQRAADDEIHEIIEEERPQARKQVLGEILRLIPAIAIAIIVFLAMDQLPAFAATWERIVTWSPGGGFMPVAGVIYAVKGAVCGAAAGWALRAVFTMIYGREAFGVGDIFILAAGGAVAGWDIVLLGLLLSIGIALVGWVLSLMMKSTVMIPFGPWLGLGFVAALWVSTPAERMIQTYAKSLRYAWEQRPDLLVVAGGLMVVASAAAIALSRLVRRWVDPADEEAAGANQEHGRTP